AAVAAAAGRKGRRQQGAGKNHEEPGQNCIRRVHRIFPLNGFFSPPGGGRGGARVPAAARAGTRRVRCSAAAAAREGSQRLPEGRSSRGSVKNTRSSRPMTSWGGC